MPNLSVVLVDTLFIASIVGEFVQSTFFMERCSGLHLKTLNVENLSGLLLESLFMAELFTRDRGMLTCRDSINGCSVGHTQGKGSVGKFLKRVEATKMYQKI